MSTRTARAFLACIAASVVVGVVLSLGRDELFDVLAYGILLPVTFAVSGCLITSRHPENPIGWLFVGFAAFTTVAELLEGYGYAAQVYGWPGGAFGEWVITWSWLCEAGFWLAIFLLFPDGRLPSPRWRPVLWLGLFGIVLALPGTALDPGTASAFAAGENPFAVDSEVVTVGFRVGVAMMSVALLAAAVSLGVRLRRSRGVERQQLKWFTCAAAAMAVLAPVSVALWYRTTLVQLLMALALCALPISATIAILRHRLYDIDVVINRALVYSALSVTLAASYLGTVVVLQFLLRPVTSGSDLAVAGSTLVVAALFRPARSRFQRSVDRRFYRSQYDAARTLDSFAGRLRDQLDADALADDICQVVEETLQPASVTLWSPVAGSTR